MKMTIGNWYRFNHDGSEYIGQYTGTDQDFECCVCGKGHKAKTFNVWYGNDYETWGFGDRHMPQITEEIADQPGTIIIGECERKGERVMI